MKKIGITLLLIATTVICFGVINFAYAAAPIANLSLNDRVWDENATLVNYTASDSKVYRTLVDLTDGNFTETAGTKGFAVRVRNVNPYTRPFILGAKVDGVKKDLVVGETAYFIHGENSIKAKNTVDNMTVANGNCIRLDGGADGTLVVPWAAYGFTTEQSGFTGIIVSQYNDQPVGTLNWLIGDVSYYDADNNTVYTVETDSSRFSTFFTNATSSKVRHDALVKSGIRFFVDGEEYSEGDVVIECDSEYVYYTQTAFFSVRAKEGVDVVSVICDGKSVQTSASGYRLPKESNFEGDISVYITTGRYSVWHLNLLSFDSDSKYVIAGASGAEISASTGATEFGSYSGIAVRLTALTDLEISVTPGTKDVIYTGTEKDGLYFATFVHDDNSVGVAESVERIYYSDGKLFLPEGYAGTLIIENRIFGGEPDSDAINVRSGEGEFILDDVAYTMNRDKQIFPVNWSGAGISPLREAAVVILVNGEAYSQDSTAVVNLSDTSVFINQDVTAFFTLKKGYIITKAQVGDVSASQTIPQSLTYRLKNNLMDTVTVSVETVAVADVSLNDCEFDGDSVSVEFTETDDKAYTIRGDMSGAMAFNSVGLAIRIGSSVKYERPLSLRIDNGGTDAVLSYTGTTADRSHVAYFVHGDSSTVSENTVDILYIKNRAIRLPSGYSGTLIVYWDQFTSAVSGCNYYGFSIVNDQAVGALGFVVDEAAFITGNNTLSRGGLTAEKYAITGGENGVLSKLNYSKVSIRSASGNIADALDVSIGREKLYFTEASKVILAPKEGYEIESLSVNGKDIWTIEEYYEYTLKKTVNDSEEFVFEVKFGYKSYDITYVGAEGDNLITSYTKEGVTLTTPSRNGYSFEGFYDNAEFTGEKITSIPAGKSGNIVLYTKWTKSGCGGNAVKLFSVVTLTAGALFVFAKRY